MSERLGGHGFDAEGRLVPRAPLSLAVRIAAPIETVWAVLCRPGDWWPGVTLDARPGGGFEERWTDHDGSPARTLGRVTELDPPHILQLSWWDEGWPARTTVTFTCRADEADLTTVGLTHAGWDALPDGLALRSAHEAGWREHLEALAAAAS